MPLWTLRLVASAGVVALLGRLPDSPTDAFLLGLGACLLAFGALVIADVLPRIARTRRDATPTHS
ncbi:MAG TPA: hypothetical protein EYQ24_16365 [Bacteroidetes bacterium]|nr:hypothetical protein [Bacteroidota bacterium]HIL57527.1 hypothetical protein [Rhodothermales bacterium]